MASKLPAAESAWEHDFEASVGYWIVLAAHAFQKTLNDELAPYGITFRQSQVLAWLVLEGELSQVELANRMMIEPGTLVGVLDRMERDALILRVATAADRRRKIIRVHPQAAEVWGQVARCGRRVRAQAVQGLTDAEVQSLIAILKKVLSNLSAR
ncbi:MAG: MarR family transcriptional regulator [Planctomycetales bacterium]|nr:MarR family transcriptional regulator [Planctomycetales bacterium]